MKITIDTDQKIIELHGEVSINELNETLVKLLGDSVSQYKITNSYQAFYIPCAQPIGWTFNSMPNFITELPTKDYFTITCNID